jgi:hypothetical protein
MCLIERKYHLVLFLLFTLLLLGFFYGQEKGKQSDKPPAISNRIVLSPNMIVRVEDEFNKRLIESTIKSYFRKVIVRKEGIYVFLDKDVWEDLSITQKSSVLLRVAQIWKDTKISIEVFPDAADPEIHFQDIDLNKELASWSEQQGGIIN